MLSPELVMVGKPLSRYHVDILIKREVVAIVS